MRYVAPVSPSQHAPCFQLPFLFALLFLSLGGLLPPALYAQEQLLEGFEETEVVSGISSPSGFRFSPDGRLFIYERIRGALRIAHYNESLRTWELEPVPFYTFDIPKENGNPSRHRSSGLRDVVFDPDYSTNGYLYALYMADSPRHNRVVRIRASAANPDRAEDGSEEVLLNLPFNNAISSGSHNGGALAIGPDGMLYITTGDGWNGGDPVQSLSTMTGKVFRIGTDGTIPQDNPFFQQTTGDYRAIYALGLRNPYTMSVHPVSGQIYINEAGGAAKASIFRLSEGANYGHQGYNGIGNQQVEWSNGASGVAGKLITGGTWYPANGYWPSTYHGAYFTPLWGTNGDATGHINYIRSESDPGAEAFASTVGQSGMKPVHTRIGPDGDLYYLLTNYENDDGRILRITWTGQVRAEAPEIVPAGGRFTDPVEVTLNTATQGGEIRYTLDGSSPGETSLRYDAPFTVSTNLTLNARVYAADLGPSTITSASFSIGTTTNMPPVVNAGPDQFVTTGTFVTLTGAGSYDPDDDELTLSWYWQQLAGPTAELFSAEDAIAFFTPAEEGEYVFQLTVQDGEAASTDEVVITVAAEPPLDTGLVAHWKLDEEAGVLAMDATGSIDGQLVQGPTWQPEAGRVGGALAFDGIDDYVDIGAMHSIEGSALTLSFWFKADDFEYHDARFISKASGVQEEDHYWMVSTMNETALRFRLKAGGSTATLISPADMIFTDTWHHVAAVYDGSFMMLYRDGEEIARMPKSGVIDRNEEVLATLGNQPPGAEDRPFDGFIDEFRVYNRALSSSAIAILSNEQTILSRDTPEAPAPFTISGNYPNPFFPNTEIQFELDRTAHVRLDVFDVTGRRVGTLVDGLINAGSHAIGFDASSLPSGLYLYRLTGGLHTESRLMQVVR